MNPLIRTLRRTASPGFTLVELMVVIAILLILMGLLMQGMQAAREKAKISLALHQVRNEIRGGAALFGEEFNGMYPPDTADYGNGETSWDAASLHTYLGSKLSTHNNTPYLRIKPEQLKPNGSGPGMIFVDPWMNPYHFDARHFIAGDPASVFGHPYNKSVPPDQQTLDYKIWSSGPDGKDTAGSHAMGGLAAFDADNIVSW